MDYFSGLRKPEADQLDTELYFRYLTASQRGKYQVHHTPMCVVGRIFGDDRRHDTVGKPHAYKALVGLGLRVMSLDLLKSVADRVIGRLSRFSNCAPNRG